LIEPIPPPQWKITEAKQWVAEQMGLPYHDDMQDWPLEVADSERIENYVQLYDRAPDAKRVVIMEMLLQATTEQSNSKNYAWLGRR
jgi:hypothetical protein